MLRLLRGEAVDTVSPVVQVLAHELESLPADVPRRWGEGLKKRYGGGRRPVAETGAGKGGGTRDEARTRRDATRRKGVRAAAGEVEEVTGMSEPGRALPADDSLRVVARGALDGLRSSANVGL